MKQPLTALITCRNEQHNIQACIESVKPIADEILIADSLSDDVTLEIIHAMGGCRVVQREFINAGDFKNWAIPQASHQWILLLDSDERVTPALRDEVVRKLASNPDRHGYWIRRANHFLGHPIRHTSWGRDRVIRLFQRDHGRYRLHTDHTEIELPEDQTGQLNERLIHYTCWSA